ncbi:MAG TPA: LysR family transcriptional regulator [Candidatus Scybalocola faecavium]|nr:LysR family transcriptional regulator [Candidatus Scybalocola faecavium]
MTLRHLKIFVEVARTGKMSAAAQNCYISQPTVSQAIRELEEHYQVRLFERLSKKLFITPEGKTLFSYAVRTLEQYQQLEDAMNGMEKGNSLRLGATITIGTCLLPGIINDLDQAIHPLSQYTYVGNTHTIEEMLLKSQLDIGIVEGIVESPDLISIPIARDYLVLAAAPDHPIARMPQVHISQLKDYSFVLRESGSGTRKLFTDYMTRVNVPLQVICEAGCPDAIKRIVLYNRYLTAISVRLVENEMKSSSLKIFLNKENAWDRSFYLVYHKDKFVTEPMRALKDIMQKYKEPWLPDPDHIGYITES